jgi:cellulose synthase/poly-beta-1,6-N-acetylglucosamine synthase-like glycosyltransferase
VLYQTKIFSAHSQKPDTLSFHSEPISLDPVTGVPKGIPMVLHRNVELHAIVKSLERAHILTDKFSRGVFYRIHETFMANQAKKAWSMISLSYLASATYFLSDISPQLYKAFMSGQISAALSAAIVSTYFLFGSIPYFCNTVVLNMVGLFNGDQKPPKPMANKDLPFVTVTIPTYNEPFEVLKNTSIKSALALDYPRDKLEIMIMSNSKTGHDEELKSYCEQNGITYLHREGRDGGKARNLNITLGLKPLDDGNFFEPKGNLYFQIDSDIEFPPDILRKSVPEFRDNENLPYAVFAVDDLADDNLFNKSLSTVNRAKSKYNNLAEQVGFATSGGFAIVYQKDAFKEVGGWKEDFVGEDWATGIELRANSAKWTNGKRIDYVRASESSPENLDRLQVQQRRWAKGSMETYRKLLPSLLSAEHIPWNEKADMAYRLSGYPFFTYMFLIAPTLLASVGLSGMVAGADFSSLYPLKSVLSKYSYPFIGLILVDSLSVLKKRNFKDAFSNIVYAYPALMAYVAASPSMLKGTVEAFMGKSKVFHVTPKGKAETNNAFVKVIKNHYREILFGTFLFGVSFVVLPLQLLFAVVGLPFVIGPFLSLVPMNRNKPK